MVKTVEQGELKCPVCHSTVVKGWKVHDGNQWWHRCISGRNHGVYELENGERHEFPEPLWFSENGCIETAHGHMHVTKQERFFE